MRAKSPGWFKDLRRCVDEKYTGNAEMDINLSSNNELAALIQDFGPRRRSYTAARAERAHAELKRGRPGHYSNRCSCGTCRGCAEDAKWERTFNDKFADPFYYSHRAPSMSSPLSSL